MKFTIIKEDAQGLSYFDEGEVEMTADQFAPPAPAMPVSQKEPCRNLLHLVLPAGWTGAQHRSPCRQVAYCLSGRAQVTTGDGDVREIGAGDIWRMEDVTGSGHITTVIGDEDVRLAIVQFD